MASDLENTRQSAMQAHSRADGFEAQLARLKAQVSTE